MAWQWLSQLSLCDEWRRVPLHRCARGYLWCWQNQLFCSALLRGAKRRRRSQSKLADCKTLAIRQPLAFAAHCSSSHSFQASPQQLAARLEGLIDAALPLATSSTPSEAAHFTALSMPDLYDDQDEVGTGLYVLIGCAAVTVVLMYSWIGYTLYQGFKARRKVD